MTKFMVSKYADLIKVGKSFINCLNKLLSPEHTGESFDAKYLKTSKALWMQGTLKFQGDWSEITKLLIKKYSFQKWTIDIYMTNTIEWNVNMWSWDKIPLTADFL